MCSNKTHSFARAIEKWFAGLREVSYNDTKRVSGKEFKQLFPSESRAFSYDFRKMKSINDNDLYYIAKVDGAMRPITRQVSFTETAAPTKCGGLCRNAKGPSCDCSCKGVNHGAGSVFSRSKDSITMTPKKSPHSRFARSSASTKALHTIYNYLEVVRTEWGEDRGIEAGRELQKAAKAIAADPSSQDIAAEIAQLVRVATTDKSYDKRDRALDDLESIINQAQSQHARRKGKTSMAQEDFKVGDKVHLGFASKGAVGFDGVITKIDSETVYIQSPEIGQFGPRTFKGPVRFLSHGFAGYYAEHSRSGSRSRMGSGDPYMENRDVKVRKGVRSDTVAFVGQNGGGGDFYAGLEIRPHSGNRFDNQLLWMKHSYATAAAAERSAVKKFDDHVARGGYSRSGVKSLMQKEYVLWGVPEGETDQLHAKVLSTQAKTPSEMDEIKRRASAAGWHSFRVQILDPDKPTRMFSRNGVKAKFGQPNTVAVRKTLQGNFEVIYWKANGKEESYSLYANEEMAKEKAKDLARQLGMQFFAGRSRFGIAERVLNDGSVHLDFKVFRESLSGKSDSSLNFIMRDAADARDAMPDGKKFNYYADIVNEVGDEIARRKNGKSRSNRLGDRKQTFEAGDSFMVEGYVGNAITGGRSARTMEEAEHYANAMLAMIKRNAGGKPVKVEIQEIKAYNPQGVIKTMHSRGESEISTRFGSIASKLGFLPDSITESNGVATLKFAQADGSAGRCAFAMIRPLTGIVGSDRVTATDTEVRVQFARRDPTKSGVSLDPYTTEQGIELRDGTMVDAKRVNGRWSIPSLPEVGGSRTFQSLVDMVTAWEGRSKASRSGGKAEFGSDVILEDIGEDQVRATARVEGRSAGSFDGPKSQSAQLLLKALKIAGQGHEVSSGVYDMTHITMNDAAKRAMPKSAMMSRGGKAKFAQANQQIADGVAQLLSVLGFAAMAEEAKTATDADTLKRYINVARRRIKGSDQADRFNTLADKLERMLMSRGGGKAEFGSETPQADVDPRDKYFEKLKKLKGVTYQGRGFYIIPAKLLDGSVGILRYRQVKQPTNRFQLTAMGDLVGWGSNHPQQNDYRLKDWQEAFPKAAMSRGGGKAEFGEIGSGGSYVSNALHHISNDITRGDKDMAKAMMRKLAERIGKESHTDAEWNQYLSLARSLGFSDNAIAGFSRSKTKTKTRFEMDQTTHRHLMTWIDNQLGNRAGSAGYIADKMIGTFNDDPERWADQGWSKVFDAAGLSSADFNNPKKGWD